MTLPLLYSFRRCPYAMPARLAIWHVGIRCELREIVLRDKPSSMIEYSAKGTVPVLVLSDRTVIDESLDVMYWALAQSDQNEWLEAPGGDLDDMRALIEVNDNEFKMHLDRYKYSDRYADVDSLHHRQEAERFLVDLDARIAANGNLFYTALKNWLERLLSLTLFQSMMVKYPTWQEGDAPTLIP